VLSLLLRCAETHTQFIRFPPEPFVEVPFSGRSAAAAAHASSPACSAVSAGGATCSVDIRHYCAAVAGSNVDIQLRCFAVNGERNEELCHVPVPRKDVPFSGAPHAVYYEWKDVDVPCRCILEVSFFVEGQHPECHLVYVGQVSKLYVMAKAESELIRCLTEVHVDDWFRSCGPNLSETPASDIRVVLPQQFSSDRYTKIMLFDLKEEDWKPHDMPRFRKLQSVQGCEFNGQLRPGNYRLYVWDSVHQMWIMDGCIIKVPEGMMPNSAVLFGHRQDTDHERAFGQFRVMDIKVSRNSLSFLICSQRRILSSRFWF
jgi:hypothetical protein